MLHSAIVVCRNGAIHGNGLFANRLIRKGTLVWELDEPTFTWKEIQAWPEKQLRVFNWYGFQCDVDRYSLPKDDSREWNHSCNPNTWWAGSNLICARRDIQVGEEVTYDYSTCDIDLELEMECHCGTPSCRGIITNRDYLNSQWQEQYGFNLPPHVLAAIEAHKHNVYLFYLSKFLLIAKRIKGMLKK
jgi:hypothetical protein